MLSFKFNEFYMLHIVFGCFLFVFLCSILSVILNFFVKFRFLLVYKKMPLLNDAIEHLGKMQHGSSHVSVSSKNEQIQVSVISVCNGVMNSIARFRFDLIHESVSH